MSETSKIDINIIDGQTDMRAARSIRETVFIIEQKVPGEIEYDEFEDTSTHILARYSGRAAGTARWRKTRYGYKLERFAVLEEVRGKGVGRALVLFILKQIESESTIYLNSQVSALGFYAGLGFKAEGEVFYEADIPHRKMTYTSEY